MLPGSIGSGVSELYRPTGCQRLGGKPGAVSLLAGSLVDRVGSVRLLPYYLIPQGLAMLAIDRDDGWRVVIDGHVHHLTAATRGRTTLVAHDDLAAG